jgi:hypothetical protein
MRALRWTAPIAICAMLAAGAAAAHHSFAAFFDNNASRTITGEVVSFRFSNPHAIIEMRVVENGIPLNWRVETNAPTLLLRRGWNRESIKPGETVTIEGWPSRDGGRYLRMRSATHEDGAPVGPPLTAADQQ